MSLSIARRPAAMLIAPLGASKPHMKIGARWRRGIVRALITVVLAALIGPATASAGWSELDDQGNTTPAGHGSAPDNTASNGDTPSGGPVLTEIDSTIATVDDSCQWTVTGRLIVRNPTVDSVDDGDPVEGVQVKVSAKSGGLVGISWYSEWDTVTTDSDGEFSVSKTECGDRQVKVQARFDSDELRATSADSHDWYQLRETDMIGPSTIDLHGEPFGGETGEQRTTQARTDAQTWIVYRKAIDYAASIERPLLNKVTVHNPATLTVGQSAADPILQEIHIDPIDTANLDTMYHELGHIWAYPREIGEGCLTTAVMPFPVGDGSFSTHDQVEEPCVAFNEGFAEFFANKIEQEMNAEGLIASTETPSTDGTNHTTTPMARAELNAQGLVSLGRVATNELGWEQVFRVLTSSDITRQLFGPGFGNGGPVSSYFGPDCAGRGMPVGQVDLAHALTVFGDAKNRFDLQDSNDPSVADLFDRAADRLAGFDEYDAIAYLNAVDPTLDSEPHDAYGC